MGRSVGRVARAGFTPGLRVARCRLGFLSGMRPAGVGDELNLFVPSSPSEEGFASRHLQCPVGSSHECAPNIDWPGPLDDSRSGVRLDSPFGTPSWLLRALLGWSLSDLIVFFLFIDYNFVHSLFRLFSCILFLLFFTYLLYSLLSCVWSF
jgi:hypothetical protein